MKKLFFILFGLICFAQPGFADVSYRISVEEIITKRNIIVRHPVTADRYLLYIGTSCGTLREGETIQLSLRDELDGNGDFIVASGLHECGIIEGHRFTDMMTVTYVLPSNTEAHVLDEGGQKYSILYPSLCSGIRGYENDRIYIERAGRTLKAGDQVVLPSRDGRCQIRHVRAFGTADAHRDEVTTDSNEDHQRPSIVKNVRAIAGDREATLTWRAASDNAGVSHYLVSHYKSPVNIRRVTVADMPNLQQTTDTNLKIGDLEVNRPYYFYVMAVDVNGNTSANWSTMVSTTPRGTVLQVEPRPQEKELNLRVVSESARSFLLQWNPPITTYRQTVILEVDGQRVYSNTSLLQTRFRVAKTDSRKGVPMKFSVKTYHRSSLELDETIEFSF